MSCTCGYSTRSCLTCSDIQVTSHDNSIVIDKYGSCIIDLSANVATTSGTSGAGGNGTSGVNGTSGTSGVTGTSGIDGTSGVNGIAGTSGLTGVSGTSGTSGISGTNGVSGTSGISPGSDFWSLTGNTGTDPSTNYIGTLDSKGLKFISNNIQSGYIDIIHNNTSLGYNSLTSLTSGSSLTAIGFESLKSATTATTIVAIGHQAFKLTTGSLDSVAVGYQALAALTTNTTRTTAVGAYALGGSVTGLSNTFVGYRAGFSAGNGDNTGVGIRVMENLTSGTWNSALGEDVLRNCTTGRNNTGAGVDALYNITTGSYNVAVGTTCGGTSTGSHNINIGHSNTLGGLDYNISIGDTVSGGGTGNNNTIIGSRLTLSSGLTDTVILATGAGVIRFQSDSAGLANIGTYGAGTHTGTATYLLGVDSSGNILETTTSAGTSGTSGAAGTSGVSGTSGVDGDTGTSATISTSNSTTTTLTNIAGLPTNCTGFLTVILVGTLSTSTGTGITGEKKVRFIKDNTTITLGTLISVMADEVDTGITGATWTIDQDGAGNIRVRVTGIAATDIDWKATYNLITIEPTV